MNLCQHLLSQSYFCKVFHFFVLIWSFQSKKVHFRRLHLQSSNQRYKNHVTFLSYWTFNRNRFVAVDLFTSNSSIQVSTALRQYCSSKKIELLQAQEINCSSQVQLMFQETFCEIFNTRLLQSAISCFRLLYARGACIKYIGVGSGEFSTFFFLNRSLSGHRPKFFMAQYILGKYFMAPRINFSFLFKTYLQQYFRVVLTVIFKFQITKEVNIHNSIQKMTFK